jgi:dihydroneopterin aldolase
MRSDARCATQDCAGVRAKKMNENGQHDTVSGHGLSIACRIGFHEYERHIEQQLRIDFDAETNWRAQARLDRAHNLVNYYDMNRVITELVHGREWRLVEAVAESIARELCACFPIHGVRVRVTKKPFDMPNCEAVSVSCYRTPKDFVGKE